MREVKIYYSNGFGKSGMLHAYVNPLNCFNRSRKVKGVNHSAVQAAIDYVIAKWYSPLRYYKIDSHVIGSNRPENALKEYWRVCDRRLMGHAFEVNLITDKTQPV